ncbi:MAG: hypothetical protein M1582_00790, partial [Actinobacteria bacterium]|nr:hypothetical protein [Actinomycetota bacterium]
MTMLVVAGLSLNNLKPRVWDSFSPYYLSTLRAVMVSYADFHKKPASRKSAMDKGLHEYLGVPEGVAVYLDNGAFCFLNSPVGMPVAEYEEFVERARPDWHPIPQDFIPTPGMSVAEQRKRYLMTMKANRAYQHDGYVPVIHVGPFLDKYVKVVLSSSKLAGKGHLALGGIVPNLLRAPKAIPYQSVLDSLHSVRSAFPKASIPIFGV